MSGKKFSWERAAIILLLLISFPITVAAGSERSALGASGIELDTFYDNFDDSSIDGSLWTTGSFEGSDPLVSVNETGGQLIITPRSGQTGLHYNGLISVRTYNFTQGTIFTEVREVTAGNADTLLSFGADNNNKIVMEKEGSSLYMRLSIAGAGVGMASIPYDSVTHRWWRIRHVAAGDTIRFDTSPDGITWTQRHSIGRGSLNISAGKVSLSAGSWGPESAPGRAVFDNLSWHPLVPNEGDWSAPVTALTPNPTTGTWDHILWGAASPSTMVKFNGKYFLYYIGAEGDTGDPQYEAIHRSLGVATSTDGINFTKYSGNPVITYTTTGGAAREEGVGSATAIVVGSTIHLYYGAIRSIGGGYVDLDVRYRSSTDGYNFTNDTLIYRSAGDEYSPLGVTYNGSTWSVYIKGPLTDGRGALSRLSGTSPTNLPNKTSVTSTTFGAGGNANYITGTIFVVHLDRREPAEDRIQVRAVNVNAPDVLSEPLFQYTFGNYGDHASPATYMDAANGKWFMYTLNLSQSPATISVQTYSPSQVALPTATVTASSTSTNTPTPAVTSTRTPTGVPLATATRTNTPAAGSTKLPSPTFTFTPATAMPGMHVGDLDGRLEPFGRNWRAVVTITVHDGSHRPVANANVSGIWNNGYSASGACTTDAAGSCTIATQKLNSTAVTFTVSGISHPSLSYQPSANHDPDGESNGSAITINMP